MLKLKHITKDYVTKQQTVHVLKDLTLNFRECEFVTILGQSGCGKTTLLNIVGGLDRYTSGDIFINEKSTKDFDDRDWDKYRNKQIGFVFQSYNLIPHLSVLQNVELALTLAGKNREERNARSLEVLKRVGLEDQAYKKPNQLSGGQMQRVAIARALVNNPDIILADEPTGALDSESGAMVMELLKEVSADRLVILVSHNADLAKQYSTRTVKLADGRIVSDDNPFVDEEDIAESEEDAAVGMTSDGNAPVPKKKSVRQRLKKTCAQIQKEKKEERKVSMKEGTALSLSARNLYSKKWRTFLTSFAGSIGIIGIALVLALSSGVSNYIAMTEESALSIYPLTIGNSDISLTELAKMLMAKSNGEEFPASTNILINKVAGNMLSGEGLSNVIFDNDMPSIKNYLDDNMNDNDGYFTCSYSSNINIYRNIPSLSTGELHDSYTKVNPFIDSFEGFVSELDNLGGIDMGKIVESYSSYLSYFTAFSEMIQNQSLLEQQYDLLGEESKWPSEQGYYIDEETGKKVYECVIQVDTFNKICDYMLFAAGLVHPEEVTNMLGGTDSDFFNTVFSIDDLLGIEYKILADSDYFFYNSTSGLYTEDRAKSTIEFVERSDITMKVVGVVRAKNHAGASSITGVVGYPHSLIEAVIERCQQSEIVEKQLNNWYGYAADDCVIDGVSYSAGDEIPILNIYSLEDYVDQDRPFVNKSIIETVQEEGSGTISAKIVEKHADASFGGTLNDSVYAYVKANMGYAEIENPDNILIYASSFEGKEHIFSLLDAYKGSSYNPTPGKGGVKYTDMLSTIMGYVKQMANAMVAALIAFSAISLIVSSIMISIITYTSVLERRKEIGVLRSIGARKIDISNLFISESSIIGIISGVLGVAFGYVFVAIANVAIKSVLDIGNLLHLNWYYALALLAISALLSLIAGIIPASIAAKKDPVEALRTE